VGAAALVFPASASAWTPLRSENPNAKKGNALMAQEQYGPALEAYDEAARELPKERAVQLNRGLALLGQDLSEQAKEAFVAAADPSSAPITRADAYYDLGIAFAREGDALSEQESYEESSAQFREAADAFKRSLRVRPGDRNAAWNLEYALKRIREEEEKQQQQEQDQQENQDQQESENQDQQESENQDQQESENQDQQESENQDQQESENQDQQESENQDQQESESENESENESANESANEQQQAQPIPRDEVQRFLDALEQNEENLPLQRARRRSAGRPPPEKDW
jgi:Ca-activated chloride channel family protein